MEIKGILISSIAVFENHIANGGEKLLGNASSIKRRPDGKVYVSGQMQRHVLFSAMDRLNQDDDNKGTTFISNGDGVSNKIEVDIRADMGGFMHPSKGDYSGRRTAPLSVTPAVALEQSEIGRDLLIRLQRNVKGEKVYSDGYIKRLDEDTAGVPDPKKQALATREFSEFDLMHMNFFLDISSLGISKAFEYENNFHINTKFFKHTAETERVRRVKLFMEATRSMNDYANQARNAISGEPQQVLIVFDNKLSRKASRYYTASDAEKINILEELDARNVAYFFGDDTKIKTKDANGKIKSQSVFQAYKDALSFLEKSSLYDPSEKDEQGKEVVQTFAEIFEIPANIPESDNTNEVE